MRPDLMELIVCPMCRGGLSLASRRTEGIEIVEGTLTCTVCHAAYPISDGIPDLLPPADRA